MLKLKLKLIQLFILTIGSLLHVTDACCSTYGSYDVTGTRIFAILNTPKNNIKIRGDDIVLTGDALWSNFDVSGSGDRAKVDGAHDDITIFGSSDKMVVDGRAATHYESGDFDKIYAKGDDNTDFIIGNHDGIAIEGTYNDAHISGDWDELKIRGHENEVGASGDCNLVFVKGNSNNLVSVNGNNDRMKVFGDYNWVGLSGDDGLVEFEGTSGWLGIVGDNDKAEVEASFSGVVSISGSNDEAGLRGHDSKIQETGDFIKAFVEGNYDYVFSSGQHDFNKVRGANSLSISSGDWDVNTVIGDNLISSVAGNDNKVLLAGEVCTPVFQSGTFSVFVPPLTAVNTGASLGAPSADNKPSANRQERIMARLTQSVSSLSEAMKADMFEGAAAFGTNLRAGLSKVSSPGESATSNVALQRIVSLNSQLKTTQLRKATKNGGTSKVLGRPLSSRSSNNKKLKGVADSTRLTVPSDPIVASVSGDNVFLRIIGRIDELHVSGQNIHVMACVSQQVDSSSPIGDDAVAVLVVGNYADLKILGKVDVLAVQGDHNKVAAGIKRSS